MTSSMDTHSAFCELTWEHKADLLEYEKQHLYENATKDDVIEDLMIIERDFEELEHEGIREGWGFLRSEVFLVALIGLVVHALNILPIYGFWHHSKHFFHVLEKHYWFLHSALILVSLWSHQGLKRISI